MLYIVQTRLEMAQILLSNTFHVCWSEQYVVNCEFSKLTLKVGQFIELNTIHDLILLL